MRAGIGRPSGPTTVTRTVPRGVRARRLRSGTAAHWLSCAPPTGIVNSSVGPFRFDTNATVDPSGLTAGAYSSVAPVVHSTGLPPSAGTAAMWFGPVTSETYTNARPSGVHA